MVTDMYLKFYCFLEAAWRRRYLLITPIWVMPILAILVSFVAPKEYKSSTAILIQEPGLLNPFLKDLAIETQLKNRIESLDAILHSRSLLTEVALDLKMFKPDSPPATQQQTVDDIAQNLAVKLVGENVVRIDYKANNPTAVVNVLTTLGNLFIQKILYPQLSPDSSSAAFLNTQLKLQNEEVKKAQKKVSEYEVKNADSLPLLKNSLSQQLNQLRERLATQTTELAGAQAAYKTLRDKLAQTSSVSGEIDNKIADLNSRLATLRTRYTDQYSEIKSILKELDELKHQKEQLQSFTKNLQSMSDEEINTLWQRASVLTPPQAGSGSVQPFLVTQLNQLQVAHEKAQALTQQVASLKEQIKTLQPQALASSQEETEFAELQRNLDVQRQLYDKLLQRFEMTKVSSDLTDFEKAERIKVIDPPSKPAIPSTPSKGMFFLAGIFAGFAVGISLATLAEFMDTSLRRRSRLQEITGLPVLGRIPSIRDPYCREIG